MRTAVVSLCLAVVAGCGLDFRPDSCPRSVSQAAAIEHGRELYLATGYVIRFIPSDQPEFRGYEVNLQARDGEPYFNTVLVRTPGRVLGITDGQPVLVVGTRADRTSDRHRRLPATGSDPGSGRRRAMGRGVTLGRHSLR